MDPLRLIADLRAHPQRIARPLAEPPYAAVAAILSEGAAGSLDLLLIRRAERRGDPWSGHIAMPGGRSERGDAGPLQTASRETEEEVGLVLPEESLLCALAPRPATRADREATFHVHLFAHYIERPQSLRLSEEVATAAWIPLLALCDASHHTSHLVQRGAEVFRFPAVALELGTLWGLSLRLLTDLFHPIGLRLPHNTPMR